MLGRVREALNGFRHALTLVSKLVLSMNSTQRARVLVVSDLGPLDMVDGGELDRLLLAYSSEPDPGASAKLRHGGTCANSVSEHVVIKTSLAGLPRLEVLPSGNPLIALHCLAAADILVQASTSFFVDAAEILSRGSKLDGRVPSTDKEDYDYDYD